MATNDQNSSSATLGGVIACLIWGAFIAVSSIFSERIGPLTACGYECLIAGTILSLTELYKGTFRSMLVHPLRYYLVCGGFWMANFSLAWIAVGLVYRPEQLVIVGMFNYLWPIFTLLGSVLLLKKKAGVLIFPGIVCTGAGLILSKAVLLDLPLFEALTRVLVLFDDNPSAYLCATLDALAWALYSNLSRRMALPNQQGAVPLFMLATSVILIAAGRWEGEVPDWNTTVALTLLLWSAASAFAYVAWDIGMRKGNIVFISSASMLIPLLSTVITCLLSGIHLTTGLLFASVCIITGAALCKRGIYD